MQTSFEESYVLPPVQSGNVAVQVVEQVEVVVDLPYAPLDL